LHQSPAARTAALLDWESAPYARTCHAQEDHLVPLFAAIGAAEGEAATRTYHDTDLFGGVTASSWRFG
jgi:aromatic ring-opening dioxygenase catalytic subunit (LigB family)